MKKLFAATVSVAALSAAALYGASAFAADMPMKAPVYKAAAPGYNWTGWYGGVNVGVGATATPVHFINQNGTVQVGTFDRGDIGFAGGVQAGYNWQFAPQWVIGFEGDIGYLGINRSVLDWDENLDFGVKTDWYATLRGRFGYTNGPSLFYATGGAAFVQLRNNFDNLNALNIAPTFASKSETATGWTVGGGVETMLDGNWSAKAEYLYIDADSQGIINPDVSITLTSRFENHFHAYKYGLNYKFGGPAIATAALPARNWTGFYTGVNAGAGLSQVTADAPLIVNFRPGTSVDIADSGFTGGVQAGYNWQFSPTWVAGLEGDISYLGIDRSLPNFANSVDFGVKADWYATLRGRLGYSTGQALLYVTGGAAFVNVKNNADRTFTSINLQSKSEIATGWTVGGGIEAALAQNWTAKTEYLYIDAGSQEVVNASAFTTSNHTAHFDNGFHVFRAGLNYQFNAAPVMAPVAARY